MQDEERDYKYSYRLDRNDHPDPDPTTRPVRTGKDTFVQPDVIRIGNLANLPPAPGMSLCPPDQHDLKPDDSEQDHNALKCTRCPYGVLTTPKALS
jgi:hypothetical protein